jgi:hypothetical protein
MARDLKIYKKLLIVCSIVVCLVMVSLSAYASQPLVVVESFKQDTVHLEIGDTTHVTRTLVIQNHIDKSVVPGDITIALQKMAPTMIGPIALPFTNKLQPLHVTNVTAMLGDGTLVTDINVTQNETATVIRYGAWMPIDANGTLTVTLSYDSPDIVDKGILFSTVEYPFSISNVPTDKAVIEITLDNGHATYVSEPPVSSGNTYVWENDQIDESKPWDVSMEYSMLPLPMLPFSSSTIVWGIIILICLAWVIWTYTRPKKK